MSLQIESAIRFIIQVYTFIIIGSLLLSWLPSLRESTLGYFLARMTDPYLRPFRQLIRPFGQIDISPIVGVITLYLAEKGLIFLLYYFF